MSKHKDLLKSYYLRMAEIHKLKSVLDLLNWDQQVYMPRLAADHRTQQIELLDRLIHSRKTDQALCSAVSSLSDVIDELSADDAVNIRETKKLLDRACKLPESFICQKSTACSIGYEAWLKARPNSDFAAVKPHLETMFSLCRQEAELIGYEDSPYDALLDEYEPGARVAGIRPLLMDLAQQLSDLLPSILGKCPRPKKMSGTFPVEKQVKFCSRIAADLGFSFETGRLDATAHPFMTNLGPQDVRVTTRYNESDPLYALYSTIHEVGHALYELGLPTQHPGTPMGMEASTGVHESQSRTWENLVGRSAGFCEYLHAVLMEFFPESAKQIVVRDLWETVNHVKPSLIRTEADEVTYSLHVVIRMLLEESLLKGEMKVDDLPEAWDGYYERYLGIRPDNVKNGVMQDVHWYCGAVGYFPSYALGNIYGAMFMDAALAENPAIFGDARIGNSNPLLQWQREHIHSQGRTYSAEGLVETVTGKPLSSEAFVNYIKHKFGV